MNVLHRYIYALLIGLFCNVQQIKSDQAGDTGLVGALPAKILLIIHYLKQQNDQDPSFIDSQTDSPRLMKNRLLLYGPPGNGKSTLAYTIAELSGSEFIKLDGPSIVGSYIGQGANAIKDFFERARNLAAAKGKCVVLFFDEIDAIAASNKTEFRAEHQAALQQLWLELDASRHESNLFIVFATNNFKKINKTFLDRFGSNTIEIKNPDLELRQQVLKHYCIMHNLPITSAIIYSLAQKSDGLSIRSLEDLIEELASITQTRSNKQLDEKEILPIVYALHKKFDENTSEDTEKQESNLQCVSMYVNIVSGVLSTILTTYQLLNLATVSH